MRIDYITAGTAGMYCGSCIRDNALAAELLAQGHKVKLIPLYTPTLTDEANVSQHKVFFGGISVYLEQYVPMFRKTPGFMDRLWDSPLVLRMLSRLCISTDPRRLGELTVSVLKGEEGFQNKELHKLRDWLESQPLPEVVNLPNSLLIGMAPTVKKALGCAVCCTLQGEDLFLEGLQEPYRTQALELIRAKVHSVDAFVAVSEYYADFMSGYLRIPRENIHVVPLGINLTGYDTGRRPGSNPFTVGYFARITPEKGLDRLCGAYRHLRRTRGLPPSRLEVAGYLGPEHKSYLHRIERQMQEWGLGDEFRYRGVLDREEKIRFLQSLSVLSVPGSYAEPKGLYLLEAMACGVPVVQPRIGAFPEILAKTGGGVLVEADDGSLADGIFSLWKNPVVAEELGRKGYEGVRRHYSAARMASRALEVYESLLRRATPAEAAATLAART